MSEVIAAQTAPDCHVGREAEGVASYNLAAMNAHVFETVRLGDIAHIEMGQSPDSRHVSENMDAGVPFLQGNAEFGVSCPQPKFSCTSPTKLSEAGDLLISVRAPVGEINRSDRPYCIGRGLAAIRMPTVPASLAARVIAAATPALRRVAQGTTFEAINKSDLCSVHVCLPPESERHTLARIIDTLDTAIRQTEAIIAKLKQVKQGLLHDLLARGIDANGELRPPQPQAPHLYKPSPLGWIPKEWEPHTLGEVLVGGTRNGLYKPGACRGRGPLMVQMGGMFRGDAVDFQSATRVQASRSELNAFGLEPGDLLFARRSLTFEGAGQSVIVRALPEPSTFESSIVRARVDRRCVEPEFAALFLRGALASAHRRTLIRQVAVSGVSSKDIAHFLIALPALSEQLAIVDAVASASNRIERESAKSHKLRLQKSGLMEDLLTGRVRVTPLLEAATA